MRRNIAASVRARLRNVAKTRAEAFQLTLLRYACERFLYRLGASPASDRCVLKGGSLLAVWLAEPYRATRDIDMLATGRADESGVRLLVETVCEVDHPDDGLTFDKSSLRIAPIRADQAYTGHQARLHGKLDNARIPIRVDFGFGDAVPQQLELAQLPTMLPDLPPPAVRIYPRTTTVAEKFEAMVKLGRRNTRMKDFHDIWALSDAFDFDGAALRQALSACFSRRRTTWSLETPLALTTPFYAAAQHQWQDYRDKGALVPPPASFVEIGERIRLFIGPVRESIVADAPFAQRWAAGGPWRPT